MHGTSMRTLPGRSLLGLAVLALTLGGGGAVAAGEDEAVKKSAGSYPSGGRTINVTRFEPARDGTYPAVLLLHGADGADTNAAAYTRLAGRLAAKGYVVFVVRYFDSFADRPKELAFFRDNLADGLSAGAGPSRDRLKRTFEECLAAVGDGVKYARTQPGVEGGRVGLVGFSLGAFLALSAATREELKVKAVVDLFGGLPEEMHKHAKGLPPVLILHGDKDQTVPVDAAHGLDRLLTDHHVVHESKVYNGVGHMFVGEAGGFRWDAALDAEGRAAAFLQKHLKAPAQGQRTAREK